MEVTNLAATEMAAGCVWPANGLALRKRRLRQKPTSHARTTLVAIESGRRRVRIDELRGLAWSYGESVNALARPESIHIDLLPRFRKAARAKHGAACQAAELLSNLASAEAELEAVLGVAPVRSYPPERPIVPGDVRAQAEADAADLRHRLGVGAAPIRDIVSLLEIDLGVRVYIRPIDSGVAGRLPTTMQLVPASC